MTTKADLSALVERVPRDDDGFVPSFDVTDEANWRAFLQHWGFVVVRILTPAECAATVTEYWAEVNRRQRIIVNNNIKAAQEFIKNGKEKEAKFLDEQQHPKMWVSEDPTSWDDINWPTSGRFVGSFPAVTPCALRNRTHVRMYQFWSALLGTPRVFAHIDAWGFMRGTKNLTVSSAVARRNAIPSLLPKKEGGEQREAKNHDDDEDAGREDEVQIIDRPEHRISLPPHVDCNPWQAVKEVGKVVSPSYQGVLAIVDCDDTVGGFSVVPNTAPNLDKWVAAQGGTEAPKTTRNHFDLPPHDAWHGKLQRVPIRRGEMVVWDSRAFHANYPNSSDQYRLVQYVRCVALDARPLPMNRDIVMADLPDQYKPDLVMRSEPPLSVLAEAAGLTDLQMQMLMVKQYPKPERT